LELLISPDGRDESLSIHQDAFVLRGALEKGQSQTYSLYDAEKNGVYVFVVDGSITIDGNTLTERDALAIDKAATLYMVANEHSLYLIFEVPMMV